MTFAAIVKQQLLSAHPVAEDKLRHAQDKITHVFPREYLAFLKIADGGLWDNQRVIMYSCGDSLAKDDQLVTANTNRGDAPLFFIGRFSEDEFGYKLNGLSPTTTELYVYDHETEETHHIANNLSDLFEKFSKPPEEKKKKWYSFLFS